jgi:hypothetical protein
VDSMFSEYILYSEIHMAMIVLHRGCSPAVLSRINCGETHILHNFFLCSVLRSTSEQHSLSHPLSLSCQQNGPFKAPARQTKSAGHAYQLCQPTNGITDRTAQTRIKGGLSEPKIINRKEYFVRHKSRSRSQPTHQ